MIKIGPAMNLIASNPSNLSIKGHAIINMAIKFLLEQKLVYHSKCHIGYKLTSRGMAVMGSMRTGICLPADFFNVRM